MAYSAITPILIGKELAVLWYLLTFIPVEKIKASGPFFSGRGEIVKIQLDEENFEFQYEPEDLKLSLQAFSNKYLREMAIERRFLGYMKDMEGR